ncbi:hypothetical protein PUMCH_003818 [Australozyma saopauloensis]|uniref:DUF747-domain-containing protein n=1 Tax=Australozyma saopauloensis TaxID=291208 RepID=A0AAX4HDR2_9ASCO|nr:hypothetical protein PUMCH_003818 [[Candida] saopauloensis]
MDDPLLLATDKSDIFDDELPINTIETSQIDDATTLNRPGINAKPHKTDAPALNRTRAFTTSYAINYIKPHNENTKTSEYATRKFVSLYKLLLLELNLPGPQSTKKKTADDDEERKRAYEQLKSMISVPFYLEKFITFGLLVCLNLFLTLFTLVPLKLCIVVFTAFRDFLLSLSQDLSILQRRLHFVKRDIITLLLIISTVALLASPVLEVSRLYHDIRGQAHIKLYVMFGVLEVTDKLLSSVSHEVFTVLVGIPFSDTSPKNLAMLALFSILALIFSACHSYALIYQSVSLHVAANSYSNALLTLLLSNQFAELKSAVFKKFEREGLFQVTLSDLTERFQLSIMLTIIAFRNISQLNSTQIGLTPDSWKSWNKWIGAIFGPSVVVLGSEIFVDWIKHCFINKFNRIRPKVYDNFLYVLSLDFIEVFNQNSEETSTETSDYVKITKRIGIPTMSLSVCLFRMVLSDLKEIYLPGTWTFWNVLASLLLIVMSFVALVVIRLLLSLWLLQWARYTKAKHELHQQRRIPQSSDSKGSLRMKDTQYASRSNFETPSPRVGKNELEEYSAPCSPDDSILPTIDAKSLISALNEDPYTSPIDSEIETSFIPGIPNTESSSINPSTRLYLYDSGEKVPPTPEEKRNEQLRKRFDKSPDVQTDEVFEPLRAVHRYEMSSKRIW